MIKIDIEAISKLQLRYQSYNVDIKVTTSISKFFARFYTKLRISAGVMIRAHLGTSAFPAGTVHVHDLST
jgi:hypothetical protein